MMVPLLALALVSGSAEDPLMSAWMMCLAESAQRFARSSETADVAADAAMGSCSDEEAAVGRRQLDRGWGANVDALASAQRDNRARVRQMVIARIMEYRAR